LVLTIVTLGILLLLIIATDPMDWKTPLLQGSANARINEFHAYAKANTAVVYMLLKSDQLPNNSGVDVDDNSKKATTKTEQISSSTIVGTKNAPKNHTETSNPKLPLKAATINNTEKLERARWPISPDETEQFEVRFKNWNNPRFRMSKPVEPCASNITTLVLVSTRPSAFSARIGIRQTWASDSKLPNNYRIHFVVGTTANTSVQERLNEEKHRFADIIQADFVDTYQNLTFKTFTIFQWMDAYCKNVQFLLKMDDDTIIDFNRLQFWIDHKIRAFGNQNKKLEFGFMFPNFKPVRDNSSKWYVPYNVYPAERFPDYLSGDAYLISSNAVSEILKFVKKVDVVSIDDMLFTGLLADLAGVLKVEGDEHFRYTLGNPVPCEKVNSTMSISRNISAINVPKPFTVNSHSARENATEMLEILKKFEQLKC